MIGWYGMWMSKNRIAVMAVNQLPKLFIPPYDKSASSIIIFDFYHKTRITPAVMNILMNYSHSGWLRNFQMLYDPTACRYVNTPSAYDAAVWWPNSCWYFSSLQMILHRAGFSASTELVVYLCANVKNHRPRMRTSAEVHPANITAVLTTISWVQYTQMHN